jgi:hypothetical protein
MSETTLQPAISTISRYGKVAKTTEIDHMDGLGKEIEQNKSPNKLLPTHADALLTTMKIGLLFLGTLKIGLMFFGAIAAEKK